MASAFSTGCPSPANGQDKRAIVNNLVVATERGSADNYNRYITQMGVNGMNLNTIAITPSNMDRINQQKAQMPKIDR